MSQIETQRPLAGITVVDFTWIGAGSYTTKILADFGADVIKIESAERLDSLRDAKPFKDGIAGVNRSGYFADRNSSKRSVTLNLKTESGRAVARSLIKQADVVANNFTPGVMEKFGLGYEAVRALKPDVVYIAMSMHGQSGPEANYLGYGLTMGAVTGLHYLCGLPDREPTGTGTNFPDHVPNPTHAAFAILAALRFRRRTGQGQLIDLAQIEPTISLIGPAVLDYTVNGSVVNRRGNEHVACAPHGVFPSAGNDQWIAITATDESQWHNLLDVLALTSLSQDPRFMSPLARWRHRDALYTLLGQATAAHSNQDLARALQHRGVTAGPVQTAEDVLLRDVQLKERGHWTYLDHAEMGPTVYNALPVQMSGAECKPHRPAPLLGEHTDEVLHEKLDLSSEEIAALRAEGALT